jgi:hypothetical protein
MPVCHVHRTIFVHIPKTAGTSVEAALGMHGLKTDVGVKPYFDQTVDREHLYGRDAQHLTAEGLKTELTGVFDGYFKFTVIRNPWDRLVSTCAWSDQKWFKGQELVSSEFARVVRQLYAASRNPESAQALLASTHFKPQFLYIVDRDLHPLVDYVARYENLAHDWTYICSRLKLDAALPARMKSHHRPYQEYYSDETRAMVGELYSRDISMFGYAF